MQPKQAVRRSGPEGRRGEARAASNQWEREWLDADATERAEAVPARSRVALLALLAVVAAVLPGIFPLTPGFATSDTAAAVAAATVTAAVALSIVPVGDRLARGLARGGADDLLIFTAALASAAAAAIHFSVAKMHFDEYALFGVFFVGSGLAQLAWPIWLLLRRWPTLLVLGAAGNAAIVALWAVDRVWGLPLGPDPWQADPVGFGDSVASGSEIVLVACCITLLVRGRGGALSRRTMLGLTVGAVALTTLSLLSVLGVGASVLTPSQ